MKKFIFTESQIKKVLKKYINEISDDYGDYLYGSYTDKISKKGEKVDTNDGSMYGDFEEPYYYTLNVDKEKGSVHKGKPTSTKNIYDREYHIQYRDDLRDKINTLERRHVFYSQRINTYEHFIRRMKKDPRDPLNNKYTISDLKGKIESMENTIINNEEKLSMLYKKLREHIANVKLNQPKSDDNPYGL